MRKTSRLLGIGMTSQRTRDRLVQSLRGEGISNEKVLEAIGQTPRHIFIEEALASRAYEETALPIGHSQTISQPYIVARMSELLLQTSSMQRVLEIGTGSGYQTAILAQLVPEVLSVERIAALQSKAKKALREMDLENIYLRHADGGLGLAEYGPYDGIIVTAAPLGIPRLLVDQLRLGGCMILPVGDEKHQALVRVIKTEQGYEKEILEPAYFVPLLDGKY